MFVYFHSGARSRQAAAVLQSMGYTNVTNIGGFTAYNFSGGFRFYDAVVNDRALIESAYSCGMDQ